MAASAQRDEANTRAGTKRAASKRASISTPATKKVKLSEATPATTPSLSKDTSRATSTPIADAPAPPPKVQKLPTRTYESRPLPSLPQRQSLDFSADEYQSIAASAVLSAALQRSRLRWIHDGFFQRYWVKPETGKHAKPPPPSNPDVKWMKSKGPCRIRVEPHVFEVDVYVEEKTKPPPPPKQYLCKVPPLKAQSPYGQAYRPQNQAQTYAPKHALNAKPQMAQPRPPIAVQQSRPLPPGSVHQVPPSQQRSQPSTFSARPPQPPHTPSQEKKGAPDPVISMLAARASSDPELKGLMKEVATGHATMEQLKVFQRHIDELTAIIQKQKKAEEALSAARPGSLAANVTPAPPPKVPQPALPANSAAKPQIQSSLQRPPITVTPSASVQPSTASPFPSQQSLASTTQPSTAPASTLQPPAVQAQPSIPPPQIQGQAPFKPQLSQGHIQQQQSQLDNQARPLVTPAPQVQTLVQPHGHPVAPAQAQAPPAPPAQPRYQAPAPAPPPVRPPVQQPWTPPAPASLPVIMAFTTAGATEDRFLFPQNSILESLSPQHTLASFIVTKKGREAVDTKGLEPDVEYWQPATIMVEVAYGREEILRCIQRWVKPAESVRAHMQEIMDRCTRAPETYLAMRLPMRGSAGAEYEDPALLRDLSPDEKPKKERRPYTKRKVKVPDAAAAAAQTGPQTEGNPNPGASTSTGSETVPATQPADPAIPTPAALAAPTGLPATTVHDSATAEIISDITPAAAKPSADASSIGEKVEKVASVVDLSGNASSDAERTETVAAVADPSAMEVDASEPATTTDESPRLKRASRKSVRISEGEAV